MKYIHYFDTTEKQKEMYNGYTQKEESGNDTIINENNVKFTTPTEDEELSNTTELPLSVSSEGSSSSPEKPNLVEYEFSPSQDILKKFEDNIEKFDSIHMKIECGEYSNEFDITKEDINHQRLIFGLTDKEDIWSKDNQFKPILDATVLPFGIIILGITETTYTSNVNITYSYKGTIEEPNYKEPYIDYDNEAKLLHYNKALDFANTVETDESHNIIPIAFIGGNDYDDNGSRVRFDYTDIIDHIMIDDELVSLDSLKSYNIDATYDDEDSGVYEMVELSKYYLGIKAEPGYHSIKYFLKNIAENSMVYGVTIDPLQTISDPKMMQPFNSLKLLKRSIIGNNITMIPRKAYYDSGLETIMIPSSITSIGEEAFAYCSKLTSIIFKGTTQQWNAITKGIDWHNEAPATVVTCMDGEVSL